VIATILGSSFHIALGITDNHISIMLVYLIMIGWSLLVPGGSFRDSSNSCWRVLINKEEETKLFELIVD
jgi:hypothetical protein